MTDKEADLLKRLVVDGPREGVCLSIGGLNAILRRLEKAGWWLAHDAPGFVRLH